MKSVVVVGAQWGDEGKGKVVDYLAGSFDYICRVAGGHNAGHTVIVGAEPVTSNAVAVAEARRVDEARPDCVLFNFAVWAFPHFAMLAASEIASPLVLVATPDPARPGLVRRSPTG